MQFQAFLYISLLAELINLLCVEQEKQEAPCSAGLWIMWLKVSEINVINSYYFYDQS